MSEWLSSLVKMVADCEERESKLSDWERGFIQSLREELDEIDPTTIFENESVLTPKQVSKLMDIHERVTS